MTFNKWAIFGTAFARILQTYSWKQFTWSAGWHHEPYLQARTLWQQLPCSHFFNLNNLSRNPGFIINLMQYLFYGIKLYKCVSWQDTAFKETPDLSEMMRIINADCNNFIIFLQQPIGMLLWLQLENLKLLYTQISTWSIIGISATSLAWRKQPERTGSCLMNWFHNYLITIINTLMY